MYLEKTAEEVIENLPEKSINDKVMNDDSVVEKMVYTPAEGNF